MKNIFLGRPLHWLLWLALASALAVLGAHSLHVRYFVPFVLILLGLAAGCVFIILATYRPGDRVTREPFEEE